ncbi:MAG: phosphatidylglycerophosphatase A [bacterium]
MSQVAKAWRTAPFSMFMATCAGIGHLPGGPGTYAAAAALPSIWYMSHHLPVWAHAVVVAVVTVFSVIWCDRAGKALQEDDSRKIVLDEWVGVWIALVPFAQLTFAELVVGFVAFRVLDVRKPFGIRKIDQHVHGGFGVMLDDVAAGLFAIVPVLAWRAFVG